MSLRITKVLLLMAAILIIFPSSVKAEKRSFGSTYFLIETEGPVGFNLSGSYPEQWRMGKDYTTGELHCDLSHSYFYSGSSKKIQPEEGECDFYKKGNKHLMLVKEGDIERGHFTVSINGRQTGGHFKCHFKAVYQGEVVGKQSYSGYASSSMSYRTTATLHGIAGPLSLEVRRAPHPFLKIKEPESNLNTRDKSITIKGIVHSKQTEKVKVNGTSYPVTQEWSFGEFEIPVGLEPGQNKIKISAKDEFGYRSEVKREVTYDTEDTVLQKMKRFLDFIRRWLLLLS